MNTFSKCTLDAKFQRIFRRNTAGNTNVLTISAQHGLINQFEYYNNQYASEDTSGYTLLRKGEFAYNKSYSEGYPLGATKKLEHYESGIVSPLYICFAAKAGVCVDFYSYYFESEPFYREIYKIAQEGARNHGLLNVSAEDFFKIKIADPPLAEQRRIAEILDCCDRGIALKKKLIAEKKRQKKALMQKLLNPDSGFRLPEFSGEWRKTTIGEIGTFAKGKGIQNSQCQKSGLPCVKYGDIYMKYNVSFDAAESFTTDDVFNNSLQVTSGALLFTCSGEDSREIGKCTLYTGKEPIAVGGDIIVMYPHESTSPVFLAYQQYSDDLIRQKNAFGKGNSIVHIHLPEISSLKISLPPTRHEQQSIADILSASDKEIDLLEQELVQQEQKKKSLMQMLLTGIVRV